VNNKIVCCLSLGIMFSLTASQRIERQVIAAQVDMNNGNTRDYEVKDVRKFETADIIEKDNLFYSYPEQIRSIDRVIGSTKINTVTSNSLVIEGSNINQYVVQFTGDSYANLKKELEKVNEVPKRNEVDYRTFQISLIDKEMTRGVSFDLTEEQFQRIMGPKTSKPKIILTTLGVAGLAIFLAYYFNLYSKCVALLGRG
jgi:hypothetical protein